MSASFSLRAAGTALLLLGATSACFAAKESNPISRLAFGSCADQALPQPIWDAVLRSRPECFVWLGDNIYGDSHDMDVLRKKYQQLASVPGFAKLKATVPMLATWDDHDYGQNDGGRDYPQRQQSQQVFLDFFGEPPATARRKRAGVYDAKIFGPPGKRLQIILLDTRYHRSPLVKRPAAEVKKLGPYTANNDPAATMLGDEQWAWLEQQFRQPAEIRIVASSIQVIPEDHGWEKWMNLPRERARLFKLIRAAKAAGVIFISGDRHLAELSTMDGGVGYPLFDLTSSSLNKSARGWRPLETNRHRMSTMNWGDNFGLIEVDWSQKDPLISLQVRDVDGKVAIQCRLPLSTLQPGTIKALAPPAGE